MRKEYCTVAALSRQEDQNESESRPKLGRRFLAFQLDHLRAVRNQDYARHIDEESVLDYARHVAKLVGQSVRSPDFGEVAIEDVIPLIREVGTAIRVPSQSDFGSQSRNPF